MTYLLQCYLSGQISERQWQLHLEDIEFKDWLKPPPSAGGTAVFRAFGDIAA